MASTASLTEYWRLARHNRNFRRLWTAQIVSELGDWFYAVAIYALLYQYTGRASSLAVAIILQVLPQALVTPFVGPVADRVSRKRLMIAADVARAGIVAAMLLVRGPETVWIVYPLLFAETVMAAFFEPARIAVIPNITGDEKAVVANTLASATWSLNFAVGAVLGGVAAAYLGRDAVFLINAASFLASAVLIGRMDFTEPHLETAPPLRARDLLDFSDMKSGLRYIRSDRRLLATVLAKAGIGVVGGTFVIFPVLGMKVYPPMRPGDAGGGGGNAGDELPAGIARAGGAAGPAGDGVVDGQRRAAAAMVHPGGIRGRGRRVLPAGLRAEPASGMLGGGVRRVGDVDRVGVYDHAAASALGGPLPWTGVCGGLRRGDAGDLGGGVGGGSGGRPRRAAAVDRARAGSVHGAAHRGVGVGDEAVEPVGNGQRAAVRHELIQPLMSAEQR